MSTQYLLDTNVMVHCVRRDETWTRIQAQFSLLIHNPTPSICVVSVGELQSLSFQWNWQASKIQQMNFILNYFHRVDIHSERIIEAYATIDAYTKKLGRPMGKNDLWIAATARATCARILTTDRDFDGISPGFVEREWINPAPPSAMP